MFLGLIKMTEHLLSVLWHCW